MNASCDAKPMVTLEHVSLGYRHNSVLEHLDGCVSQGTLTAIVGSNGSGKSTLLKAIAGIIKPTHGNIHIGCERKQVAYLSQIIDVDRSFPINVFDFAACGLWNRTGAFHAIDGLLATQVELALDAVGMLNFKNTQIHALSGGQFQRVRFAQIFLQKAQLVLLDEPFTGIDEPTVNTLMRLIHQWQDKGATLLVVLHDTDLIWQQFSQTMILSQHKILHWGDTRTTLNHQKASPRTPI